MLIFGIISLVLLVIEFLILGFVFCCVGAEDNQFPFFALLGLTFIMIPPIIFIALNIQ